MAKFFNRRKFRDNKKKSKYNEFLSLGGSKSGVFDISDKKTRKFVKKYKKYIPKKDIYKRNKRNELVAVSFKQRRKDCKWLKNYNRKKQ